MSPSNSRKKDGEYELFYPRRDSPFSSSPTNFPGNVIGHHPLFSPVPRPASATPVLSSESASIDRLFSNLLLEPDQDWTPARQTPWPAIEEDPIFKNDLAHVLVWFREDLTTDQRFATVFTLMRNLSKCQQEMLQRCLHEPGVPVKPPTPSEPQPLPELFYKDLNGWLRFHRLHKYWPVLQSTDQRRLVNMNEQQLEALGVGTLGARRKFLKLFELVKNSNYRN